MQIQTSTDYSSPYFGIKYVRPRFWNKGVLKTLQESNLVKEIDAKYPNAEARYRSGLINCRVIFKLDKQEKYTLKAIHPSYLMGSIKCGTIETLKSAKNHEDAMRQLKKKLRRANCN